MRATIGKGQNNALTTSAYELATLSIVYKVVILHRQSLPPCILRLVCDYQLEFSFFVVPSLY